MSGRSGTGSTGGQTQPDIRTVHMVKQGLGHIMKVHTGIFSGLITITGTQLFLKGHMTTLLNDNHSKKKGKSVVFCPLVNTVKREQMTCI